MTDTSGQKRTDSSSRTIRAPPQIIYQAFMDRRAVARWRAPKGMTCRIFAFNSSEGGTFRMSFEYTDTEHTVRGKTSEHGDVFQGQFVELVPGMRIVERVEFDSENSAFSGTMMVTTAFTVVRDGTEVILMCENVPEGISQDDHRKGMASTLENLAAYTEEGSQR